MAVRLAAIFLIVILSAACDRAADLTARPSASPAEATLTTSPIATSTVAARPTASPSPTAARTPSGTPGEAPTADDERVVAAMVAFARARDARSFAALPLANTVGLALDDQIPLPRPASALARADGWVLDVDEFHGRVGPFSALDLLAMDVPTMISIGP